MSETVTLNEEREKRIDAAEYFKLVLSNRRLERRDGANDVLGLYDPETGQRFTIEREHLLAETIGARSYKPVAK
ncbi:MAG: hypothetical protein KDB27_17570 [Planctomycetales bacterium]|nr:hypothetical protein [Planctomycetales bacterium]